jgi:hypothetical protein
MRTALFVGRDLRTTVENTFIGRALTNALIVDIDATVNFKLVQYTDLGYFNGDPAYFGYKRTIQGDQVKIEFNANITLPANFIFITANLDVLADLGAA